MAHLVISFHLSDLLFDELMIRDLGSKRLTSICIGNRCISRSANNTGGARSNRVASLLQGEHRDLEPLTFLSNHVCLRNTNVLKRKVTGVPCSNSQFAVNCA